MYLTCSIALCGKEVDLISAQNLWDYKEKQLLAQPHRELQHEYNKPTSSGAAGDLDYYCEIRSSRTQVNEDV